MMRIRMLKRFRNWWVLLTLLLSQRSAEAIRRINLAPPVHRTMSHSSSHTRRSQTVENSAAGHRRWSQSSAKISPKDHLVSTSLPLWNDSDSPFPTAHWAGHVPASAVDDKYLFYWLFAPPSFSFTTTTTQTGIPADPERSIPLIIWLNGGPGCSSMDGLWLENGPFRLRTDPSTLQYQVHADPNSWHLTPAFVLYIDQPVGTGLSFTKSGTYAGNDTQVNDDFYFFLQSFFTLHQELFVTHTNDGTVVVNRPVYFSGESHAGHYIPSMMNYILKQNDDIQSSLSSSQSQSSSQPETVKRIEIPLAGAAIGNGWMDPYYQYAAAEAAYGKGIIGRAQWHSLNQDEMKCQKHIQAGEYSTLVCYLLLSDVVDASQGASLPYRVSTYDARRTEPKHGSRAFPPGHKVVETYLGGWDLPSDDAGDLSPDVTEEVLQTIHATAAAGAQQIYRECTDPPYAALAHLDGSGVVPDVVQVLQHVTKPRLLFFNGIEDLICNHVGNEKMLENLPWNGRDAWIKSTRYAWKAASDEEGKVSGYMKEYDNLSFLKILGAGHMVPMDVPSVAFEMIKIFVTNQSFDMSKQSIKSAPDSTLPSCPACSTCPSCPICSNTKDNGNSLASDPCKSCPPVSPPPPALSTGDSTPLSHTSASIVIDKAVLGGMIGISLLLGSLIMCMLLRKGHPARAIPVPQYDLELRPRQSYTDDLDAHVLS